MTKKREKIVAPLSILQSFFLTPQHRIKVDILEITNVLSPPSKNSNHEHNNKSELLKFTLLNDCYVFSAIEYGPIPYATNVYTYYTSTRGTEKHLIQAELHNQPPLLHTIFFLTHKNMTILINETDGLPCTNFFQNIPISLNENQSIRDIHNNKVVSSKPVEKKNLISYGTDDAVMDFDDLIDASFDDISKHYGHKTFHGIVKTTFPLPLSKDKFTTWVLQCYDFDNAETLNLYVYVVDDTIKKRRTSSHSGRRLQLSSKQLATLCREPCLTFSYMPQTKKKCHLYAGDLLKWDINSKSFFEDFNDMNFNV